MEYKTLPNGIEIPKLGLGTWQITDREILSPLLTTAIWQGCSFIDTAAAYSNELSIGKILSSLETPREKLFLQSKVWNTNRGFEQVQAACKASLKKLKTDYLDSYLIHWPASPNIHENWEELNAETWRGMEVLLKDGLVRAIGVCNFKVRHLESLAKNSSVLPMILQTEFHPGMNGAELSQTILWCKNHGVILQASSPLGNGQILQNEEIFKIAHENQKSPAQICLRYALQKDFIAIPKTANPARLKENIAVFDFSLSEQEMQTLDTLPFCGGLNLDPDEVTQFE